MGRKNRGRKEEAEGPHQLVKMIVNLNVDELPEELYQLFLKELAKQHGAGTYTDWVLAAKKED